MAILRRALIRTSGPAASVPSGSTSGRSARRRRRLAGSLALAVALSVPLSLPLGLSTPAVASPPTASASAAEFDGPGPCAPRALAYDYSDRLDKVDYDGIRVGGLSNIGYDRRLHSYVSSVDDHLSDPARLWFYRDLDHPKIWRDPLVLKAPNGTPYTGQTADNEGLAVLPDSRFLISSETEPSIRIFGRDGIQQQQLPIPARFRVAPGGEATKNALLEGLTTSRSGRTVVAAMEGTLSGDTPPGDGAADFRRFLVYGKQGSHYRLTKQVGYRVDDGLRISEVQSYAPGKLLIMEAQYDPELGNVIKLYAVTGFDHAADVSAISNLSSAPGKVMKKTLIADVTACPSLGATARQPQANPLMDNYEGMLTRRYTRHSYGVTLLSDDNFNPVQVTRLLELVALLP